MKSESVKPYLKATMVASAGHLIVSYEVHAGDQAIVVFDRLAQMAHQDNRDPEMAYRYLVGEELRLLLGIAPLPWDRSVFAKNVPDVTKLGPYRTASSSFTIAVPVTEYSCYARKSSLETNPSRHAATATLFVDYIEGVAVETQPSRSIEGAHTVTSTFASNKVERLRAAPIKVDLPVRRARGPFSRLSLPGEQVDQGAGEAVEPAHDGADSDPLGGF